MSQRSSQPSGDLTGHEFGTLAESGLAKVTARGCEPQHVRMIDAAASRSWSRVSSTTPSTRTRARPSSWARDASTTAWSELAAAQRESVSAAAIQRAVALFDPV